MHGSGKHIRLIGIFLQGELMKTQIKLLKDRFGWKAGEVHELELTQARELVEKGYAEEVNADGPTIENATKGLFNQVQEFVTDLFTRHTREVEQNVGRHIKAASDAIVVGPDGWERDPHLGLSKGEYFQLVKRAAYGHMDERLTKIHKSITTKAAGANESTSADGGFAVPVVYANRLWDDLVRDESLFGRCFNLTLTTGNSLRLPKDNNTSIGAFGVSATWLGAAGGDSGEAVQIATSKPVLGQATFQLNDLGVMVPITSDLAEDNNVALEQYIMSRAQLALEWKITDAIVRGNAAGIPTGFLGHSGTVVVDKDAGQAAGTFSYSNLLNMYSRFVGDPANAVWIYNRQLIPQIMTMQDAAGRNIYFPPGGLANKPYGTLLGIAAMPCDHCSGPGDSGDIALCDLSQYFAITKGAPQMAMSIHLYFDTNQLAYRWIFRMDGKPVRTAPFTPAYGDSAKTLGYFLVLADRHA
jgi:HK97 family phage major capsid protein